MSELPRVEKLREHAKRCRALAKEAKSAGYQGEMEDAARQYEKIAEQVETLAKTRPRYP
jgi:hypothetical protein